MEGLLGRFKREGNCNALCVATTTNCQKLVVCFGGQKCEISFTGIKSLSLGVFGENLFLTSSTFRWLLALLGFVISIFFSLPSPLWPISPSFSAPLQRYCGYLCLRFTHIIFTSEFLCIIMSAKTLFPYKKMFEGSSNWDLLSLEIISQPATWIDLKHTKSWVWWFTSVIPALGRLRQVQGQPGVYSVTLSQKQS
jgi:hypothetical protein